MIAAVIFLPVIKAMVIEISTPPDASTLSTSLHRAFQRCRDITDAFMDVRRHAAITSRKGVGRESVDAADYRRSHTLATLIRRDYRLMRIDG